MPENNRIQEQRDLWNGRARKDGLVTVMCSDFSDKEARSADISQKGVISRLLTQHDKTENGLEIGCGFGRLSMKWLEFVDTLFITDISEKMIQKLPRVTGIHPIIADCSNLPLPNNFFNSIFVSNILGHFRDDIDLKTVVGEIDRVSNLSSLLFIDEMIGQEGELIAEHYLIRNPDTISGLFPYWSVSGRESYMFGRQPHTATIYIKSHSL